MSQATASTRADAFPSVAHLLHVEVDGRNGFLEMLVIVVMSTAAIVAVVVLVLAPAVVVVSAGAVVVVLVVVLVLAHGSLQPSIFSPVQCTSPDEPKDVPLNPF
jgi:hypothetical protein